MVLSEDSYSITFGGWLVLLAEGKGRDGIEGLRFLRVFFFVYYSSFVDTYRIVVVLT